MQWRQTLANRTLALHLPGGRQLYSWRQAAHCGHSNAPAVCYERKRRRLNRLGVGRGPKKFGDAGVPLPGKMGCGDPVRNMHLLHLSYLVSFGHSRSNHTSVITEIPTKNWPLASHVLRSLKVTGTDVDRSATYDFKLVCHSNYTALSRSVSETTGDIGKSFPHTTYLMPPLTGYPWNFVIVTGSKNQNDAPTGMSKKSWRYVHLFRHKTGIGLTDRRTDRIIKQYCALRDTW